MAFIEEFIEYLNQYFLTETNVVLGGWLLRRLLITKYSNRYYNTVISWNATDIYAHLRLTLNSEAAAATSPVLLSRGLPRKMFSVRIRSSSCFFSAS